MNLFVISLIYKSSLPEVDKYLAGHNHFLRKYYDNGTFICSGPKVPRTGGIILCKSERIENVKTIIAEDPFNLNKVADYEITEFCVADAAIEFNAILNILKT